MLANLQEKLSGVEAGKPETYTGQLKEILTNKAIFGVDMYEAGLADKVEGMFVEMLAGKDCCSQYFKEICRLIKIIFRATGRLLYF